MALKQLMQARNFEYQSEFARKYFAGGKAEGKTEGKAELLLLLLRRRGFPIDAAVEGRVAGCRDDKQFDTWAERILTATSLDDVFAD